mgnify:CR=1 FL=1
MARLDTDKQKTLEPKRMDYAVKQITELGYEITAQYPTELRFNYKGFTIRLFPYSGWFTGKSVKDGRGIDNLLEQIKP